jgi:regulator of ribonuclease activity A
MKSSFAPLCLGDLKSKKGWLLKNHHDGRILTNGGECKKNEGRGMMVKTADLCDQFLDELQVCDLAFQSYGGKQMFSGPIATVDVFEDNVLVREALETVPPGTVLVVDGKGSRRVALLGDRLAQIACERGLAGVIIHGCIRDSAEISTMPIGVMAIGTCPVKSKKEGKGVRDTALEFGGVRWEPGAYVYADADGIVIAQMNLSEKHD